MKNFNFPWLEKIPNTGVCLYYINASEDSDLTIQFDCLWSDSQPGSNILLVIKGDNINELRARQLGFFPSEYGYYRYLKNLINNGLVCVDFKISPDVKEIWLIPFCTRNMVYINKIKCSANKIVNIRSALRSSLNENILPIEVPNDTILVNARLLKNACDDACCIHFNKWFDSMDGFASRWGAHLDRDSVILKLDDNAFPAILHRGRPALLKIPKNISEWMHQIGDKSRNMISKARRLGYYFEDVEHSDVGQDIYEIRTSDPMRQGRSIPDYFYTNPPKFVLERSKVGCTDHDEIFVGVFHSGKLVSYITVFVFGELAEINHILCHAGHLNKGVMNLNMYFVVDILIKKKPFVKFLNYLYLNDSKNNGIDLFKKSMGFKSMGIAVYDGRVDLTIPDPSAVLKINDQDLSIKIGGREKYAKKVKSNSYTNVYTGDLFKKSDIFDIMNVDSDRIVFLNEPDAENFIKFWSSEIRNLAHSLQIGCLLAVPFPNGLSIDDSYDNSKYLSKRFKANPHVDVEGLRCAFKGSIFRLAAFMNLRIKNETNKAMIVLEKISD